MYPSSSRRRSNTLLAVCLCFLGAPRSVSSQDSTVRAWGRIVGLSGAGATGGSGEKSPFLTYFETVFRLIPRVRAISRSEHPPRVHLANAALRFD